MGAVKELHLNGLCTGEHELDKRFYVPGTTLSGKCAQCDTAVEVDFGSHYLSYPITNKPKDVWLYCDKCESELGPVKVVLRISLELAAAAEDAPPEATAEARGE